MPPINRMRVVPNKPNGEQKFYGGEAVIPVVSPVPNALTATSVVSSTSEQVSTLVIFQPSVFVVNIVLTQTMLLHLHTLPTIVCPAPGIGKMNVLIQGTMRIHLTAGNFNSHGNDDGLWYGQTVNQASTALSAAMGDNEDCLCSVLPYLNSQPSFDPTTVDNIPILFYAPSGDSTMDGGLGMTLFLSVMYYVANIA